MRSRTGRQHLGCGGRPVWLQQRWMRPPGSDLHTGGLLLSFVPYSSTPPGSLQRLCLFCTLYLVYLPGGQILLNHWINQSPPHYPMTRQWVGHGVNRLLSPATVPTHYWPLIPFCFKQDDSQSSCVAAFQATHHRGIRCGLWHSSYHRLKWGKDVCSSVKEPSLLWPLQVSRDGELGCSTEGKSYLKRKKKFSFVFNFVSYHLLKTRLHKLVLIEVFWLYVFVSTSV